MELEEDSPDVRTNQLPENNVREIKSRRLRLLTARKRKKPFPESKLMKFAPEILKQSFTDTLTIRNYIKQKYKEDPDKEVLNVLAVLGKSKIVNGKVLLSDKFANNMLYFHVGMIMDSTKQVFCNDNLYLSYRYESMYTRLSKQKENMNVLQYMLNAEMVKAYYVSQSFVYDGPIKKGFYQDYKGDFSAVGTHLVEEAKVQELINGFDRNKCVYFYYKDVRYDVLTWPQNKDIAVIAQDSANNEDVRKHMAEDFTNMKVFHGGTKKAEIGLKDVKASKIRKAKFFDMRINPDSFCPAFFLLEKEPGVKVYEIFKMKYDLNILFKSLDDEYKKNNGFLFYKNFCYWDNFSTWYDFLSVYALTSSILKEKDKKILIAYVDDYYLNREVLNMWKPLQLLFQRILKEFFNSFQNAIQVGRLEIIRTKLKKYIDDTKTLREDSSFGELKSFLDSTQQYSWMMYKQMDPKMFTLAEAMLEIIDTFLSGKITGQIIESLKDVGQAIYYLSVSGTSSYIFPIVLSPGAFLGSLVYNGKKITLLEEIIANFKERTEKKEYDKDEMLNINFDFQKNQDAYRKDVVIANVRKFISNNGLPLSSDNFQNLVNSCMINFKKDPKKLEILDKAILRFKMDNRSIKEIDFGQDEISKWARNYARDLQSMLLADQNKKNEAIIENNNLINENNKLIEGEKKNLLPQPENPSIKSTDAVANPPRKRGPPRGGPQRRSGFMNIRTNIEADDMFSIPVITENSYDDLDNLQKFLEADKRGELIIAKDNILPDILIKEEPVKKESDMDIEKSESENEGPVIVTDKKEEAQKLADFLKKCENDEIKITPDVKLDTTKIIQEIDGLGLESIEKEEDEKSGDEDITEIKRKKRKKKKKNENEDDDNSEKEVDEFIKELGNNNLIPQSQEDISQKKESSTVLSGKTTKGTLGKDEKKMMSKILSQPVNEEINKEMKKKINEINKKEERLKNIAKKYGKIKEDDLSANEMLERYHKNNYDDDDDNRFISNDVLEDEKPLSYHFQKIYEQNGGDDMKNKSRIKVSNNIYTPVKLMPMARYLTDLLKWWKKIGIPGITVIPTSLNNDIRDILPTFVKNYKVSDNVLRSIGMNIPAFGTIKDVMSAVNNKPNNKIISDFNKNLNNINKGVVIYLVNKDRENWPNYKPPEEADESYHRDTDDFGGMISSESNGDLLSDYVPMENEKTRKNKFFRKKLVKKSKK